MKNDLKVKYLRYLSAKKQNEGFTLIELLVVIIIIGILSAIALPSFLNQANKARESEAKQYAGSMNRAQQAVFLERSTFTTDFGRLGLGIASNTANYQYAAGSPDGNSTFTVTTGALAATIDPAAADTNRLKQAVISTGAPKNTDILRAYIGAVDVLTEQSGGSNASTTTAILCQTIKPQAINGTAGNMVNITLGTTPDTPSCGSEVDPVE